MCLGTVCLNLVGYTTTTFSDAGAVGPATGDKSYLTPSVLPRAATMAVKSIKVGILRRDVRARLLSGDYAMLCIELCCGEGLDISSSVPQRVLAVRVEASMLDEDDLTKSLHVMIRLAALYDVRVHASISTWEPTTTPRR